MKPLLQTEFSELSSGVGVGCWQQGHELTASAIYSVNHIYRMAMISIFSLHPLAELSRGWSERPQPAASAATILPNATLFLDEVTRKTMFMWGCDWGVCFVLSLSSQAGRGVKHDLKDYRPIPETVKIIVRTPPRSYVNISLQIPYIGNDKSHDRRGTYLSNCKKCRRIVSSSIYVTRG